MPKKNTSKKPEEEVVFEGEGIEKLQKIKEELKICEKEKKEYLDGWKRAKADAVNEKKRYQERIVMETNNALEKHISELLPVFDSVLSARKGEENDTNMKEGIEQLHTQFLKAFTALGVEILSPEGEVFDPHTQQAVGTKPTQEKKNIDKVVEVARVGAKTEHKVIRPAMVYIGVKEEEK